MYLKNIARIVYRCKMIASAVRLKICLIIFGQNMSIENINSMPSEARQKKFEIFCIIQVYKGVIWAPEYNLGSQKWG